MEVIVIDDNVYEGTQEFRARLTTTDSGVNLFETDAVARITDDDGNTYKYNCTDKKVKGKRKRKIVVTKTFWPNYYLI